MGFIVLDDCNFDQTVDTSEFDLNRTLKIKPPQGEFTVMNYRITSEFIPPFRINPFIDQSDNFPIKVLLTIKANYVKQIKASYCIVKFPCPRGTSHVYNNCLLYTSPSLRDRTRSRMPSSA